MAKTAEEKLAARQEAAKARLKQAEERALTKKAVAAQRAYEDGLIDVKAGELLKVTPTEVVQLDPSKRMVSLDTARVAGYAIWRRGRLLEAGVIQPLKLKKAFRPWDKWVRIVEFTRGGPPAPYAFTFDNEEGAWGSLRMLVCSAAGELVETGQGDPVAYVAYEQTYVGNVTTAKDLNQRRGRVDVYLGVARGEAEAFDVNISEWRRIAYETLGVVYPSGESKPTKKEKDVRQALIKAKSIEAVADPKRGWGIVLTNDAAEGVLIGNYMNKTHMAAVPPSEKK